MSKSLRQELHELIKAYGKNELLAVEVVVKLVELVGPELKVGDAVIVPDDITTKGGGFVGYDGTVTAEVLALEDEDGDILVTAQNMEQYIDPAKVKLVE